MQCVYQWDDAVEGLLLSAYFWGNVLFMVPGGIAISRYGAYKIFAVGVGLTSIFSVLVPLVAYSLPVLALTRALTGAAQGLMSACWVGVATEWYPNQGKVDPLFLGTMRGSLHTNEGPRSYT